MIELLDDSPGKPRTRPLAGWAAFLLGAVALILVIVHFFAGPFAPQQDVSISVGEIAAEMREAAKRAVTGAPQPEPQAQPWDIDRVLEAGAGSIASLALILGLASLALRERRMPAAAGLVLGAGAIAFQMFTWMVMLLIGALILAAIMANISEILGE